MAEFVIFYIAGADVHEQHAWTWLGFSDYAELGVTKNPSFGLNDSSPVVIGMEVKNFHGKALRGFKVQLIEFFSVLEKLTVLSVFRTKSQCTDKKRALS